MVSRASPGVVAELRSCAHRTRLWSSVCDPHFGRVVVRVVGNPGISALRVRRDKANTNVHACLSSSADNIVNKRERHRIVHWRSSLTAAVHTHTLDTNRTQANLKRSNPNVSEGQKQPSRKPVQSP